MDKRYQVFVSSTFTDLKEERQAVMETLLGLDHFPAGMELFPATDDDQLTMIKGVIDDSDYYVIIIGARYGSVDADGVSYTEREFDYAVSKGIPVLAFLHDNPDGLAVLKTDKSDEFRQKLEAFREKVKTGRVVKFWKSADDLRAKVFHAVSAETKRTPQVGWVRANRASDPARLNDLLQEIERLKRLLNEARTLPPPDTEKYAQGQDKLRISFWTKTSYKAEEDWHEVELAWDTIFYEIGPLILIEASEDRIMKSLSLELERYGAETDGAYYARSIDSDSFHTIKVQLIALGLMRKSTIKHSPSDTKAYWSITPYGEQYLMSLRALRRAPRPAARITPASDQSA